MEIRANIARTVREIMREQKKTLTELSDELDIPLSSMKKYASGQSNPRADTIELLADKLGVTPEELISSLPQGWRQAETTLQAAKVFGSLLPEQRERGIQLFLEMVALFSPKE